MAVAGEGIPSALVRLQGGVPTLISATQHTPVSICYSPWGKGLGTLEDAIQHLKDGQTVRLDMRGGSYIQLKDVVCRSE